jgi:hypothetical protein
VEADISGGSIYTDMGTVQLISVPYALYAKNAGNVFSGNYNDLTNAPDFTGWDQDVTNDFDGNYNNLTNKPVLSGDVTGQTNANTVVAIQGMDISANVPANGQVLKWNNATSVWEPSDDQLGAAGTTDGVVTGASFSGTATKTMTLIRSNGLGDITAVFTDLVNDADADPANEIQTLSLAGSDLTISGGNTITLPAGATYTAGNGIDIQAGEISNTAPDQAVTLTGSGATTVSGTYPNFTISSTDNVNDADANSTNELQTLTINGNDLTISDGNTVTLPQNIYVAGSDIAIVGNVINNAAPDQTVNISEGTGIQVTGTYPDFTIANIAPNQTVNINGSGATTVTGTYPNFTISSTDNNTTYTAGSGIGFSGTTINNTAPDQTVTINGSGATVVTGSYPNFNISSTDNNTTYTAGTGLSLSGTVFTANNTDAMWNSNLLQGVGVSTTAPVNGQILKYDGTNWIPAADNNTTYTAGTGLTLSGTTFSHNAHSGDVTGATALTVTGIQGRQVTSNAPANGQVLKWNTSNSRWELGDDELGAAGTNDGVVTSIGVTGTTTKTITLTRSQSLPDLTATFTDDGSVYTAGSGISISGNEIANTAPDQTITLTGSGATSISGTYPDFTISSTNTTYTAGTGMTLSGTTFNAQTANALWNANQLQGVGITTTTPATNQVLKYNGTSWTPAADNNTTYNAGSGISIIGSDIINTAPDQAITLIPGGSTSISGTYPTFTISSTDQNTTYTAGTGMSLSGTTFNCTQTLAQTLANGNSAGTYSINMNSQNITNANILGLRNSNAAYIDMYYGHIRDYNNSHGVDGQVLRVHGTSPNTYVTWDNPSTLLTAGNGLSYSGSTLNTVWSVNGTHIYNNNTGNVGVGINAPNARLTIKSNSSAPTTEPLFEIKNRLGQTVFVVYEDSVRIFIDDDPSKSNRGAFAVSGRNTTKAFTHDFLVVKPEFSRVYTGDPLLGFGVENISGTSSDSYMRLTPENYFIGHQSGLNTVPAAGDFGRYNVFLGFHTGFVNVNGYSNVFLGYKAGYSNDGVKNIFIGTETGYNNTTGHSNVFIGNNTGRANTTGITNVFIGNECALSNTGSHGNVYIGYWAGRYATGTNNVSLGLGAGYRVTGEKNVSLGHSAGMYNTSGNNNLYLGSSSGFFNQTGSSNVTLGFEAGYGVSNSSYSNNVFIGYQAGRSNATGTGNIYIGYQSAYSFNSSNLLVIENSNDVTNPLIYGDFAANRIAFHRTATAYPLQVGVAGSGINGNGAYLTAGGTWTAGSSRSFKDRFVSLDGKDILNKIEGMELKGWFYKETQEYHIGPFAEDFYQAFGTGVLDVKEDLGRFLSPTDVAGVSMVAIQELIKEINELKSLVKKQQEQIEQLQKK